MYAVARPVVMPCSRALCAVALYLSVSVFTTAEAGERPPTPPMLAIIPHVSVFFLVPIHCMKHIVCERSSTLEVTEFSLPLLLELADQRSIYNRHLSHSNKLTASRYLSMTYPTQT